ncbi:MAG: protocatechuate 3,4-dioxygenase subunit alpha [Candidatus Limnocylindrales bacterium]
MSLPRTASQTVGPYFGFALPWPDGPFAARAGAPGAIWIRGRVTDGAGEPVDDALIETWQADPAGRFPEATGAAASGFRGFARCPTDCRGEYAILTLKPGRVAAPEGGLQAPHIDVLVFARGLLKHLMTRIYFADEASNGEDPVLAGLADVDLRGTLVAERTDDGYRFDIRLQGERETVFFDA